MKTLLKAIFVFLPMYANASLYCGELDEKREWFESKVTIESAEVALAKIALFNRELPDADYPAAENALRIIEARMYLSFINAHKKNFGELDQILVDEYCEFLNDKGFFVD